MIRIPCFLSITSLFLFSSIGCTSLSLPHFGQSSAAKASGKPARCLCLWQPVNTQDEAGRAVRGFGGQVYFFEANSEEPVAVAGDVRVFIFDDVGTPEQQARPKDIQNYDQFVWKSFLSQSQFGTNYKLFVPYQRDDEYERVCSLRLRLVRPDGTQLFSDMATVKLDGEPRDDKSIRQLVSPRENSIRPDRSRELRVELQQRGEANDRAATIGSIQEGSLSMSGNDSNSDRNIDEHARIKIQRYEARLAEMHAEFEKNNAQRQQHSSPDIREKISDLLPAIQNVSRQNNATHQRVTPAARDVFATEEPQHVEHADFSNDRSQSATWGESSLQHHWRQHSRPNADAAIHRLSRPLNRRPQQPKPASFEDDQLLALQLARISE
ncbi:MAG: hypothetical protein HQ518_17030 [Rhodopirellula sp.]|nr:hypothetical protein [Rhodopirellula sp.]